MSTPRTEKAKQESKDIEGIFPLVDEARKLENDLDAATKERDAWASKCITEMVKYANHIAAERVKVEKLRDAVSDLLYPSGKFTRADIEKLIACPEATEETE